MANCPNLDDGAARVAAKAFTPIDGGHFACFTDPEQFLATHRRDVSPLT